MSKTLSPQVFHADCGRRRGFLSQRDADAYTQGYYDHPRVLQPLRGGPYTDGYFDREDEVMEQFDRDNNWGDIGSEFDGVAA